MVRHKKRDFWGWKPQRSDKWAVDMMFPAEVDEKRVRAALAMLHKYNKRKRFGSLMFDLECGFLKLPGTMEQREVMDVALKVIKASRLAGVHVRLAVMKADNLLVRWEETV